MIDSLFRWRVVSRLVIAMFSAVLVSSGNTRLTANPEVNDQPHLTEKHYVSFDGDRFGYRKWVPGLGADRAVKMVIVGVHGISGHAGDYDNLGKYLLRHLPGVALYAAETRGQGMDEKVFRRGDILRTEEWYKDLLTFTRLVRKQHPGVKLVWLGESMGSLIVMHAYSRVPKLEFRPDAMVVTSPIVDVTSKVEKWKLWIMRVCSWLMPKLRVSLETLSDGQRAVVTEDDMHEEQAAKNPWYIRRYTLRLLLRLGEMAESMTEQAARVRCPVLVVHGGKDIFTEEKDVNTFFRHFPVAGKKTKKYYPGSYHLLMYDHDREKIFKDISVWLAALNHNRPVGE